MPWAALRFRASGENKERAPTGRVANIWDLRRLHLRASRRLARCTTQFEQARAHHRSESREAQRTSGDVMEMACPLSISRNASLSLSSPWGESLRAWEDRDGRTLGFVRWIDSRAALAWRCAVAPKPTSGFIFAAAAAAAAARLSLSMCHAAPGSVISELTCGRASSVPTTSGCPCQPRAAVVAWRRLTLTARRAGASAPYGGR